MSRRNEGFGNEHPLSLGGWRITPLLAGGLAFAIASTFTPKEPKVTCAVRAQSGDTFEAYAEGAQLTTEGADVAIKEMRQLSDFGNEPASGQWARLSNVAVCGRLALENGREVAWFVSPPYAKHVQ